MKKTIIIRSIEDDSEAKRFDVTGKSDRAIERMENGMNINLDHARFYTTIEESPDA